MDLSILKGPVIGAMIGYGTNWIAIKMLFRPRRPIKIGRFTLPFTPGIIPKRKEKLAKAIGQMVGDNLFTRNDMQEILLSEEIEVAIVNGMLSFLGREESLKSVLLETLDEEKYFSLRENLKWLMSKKIQTGLLQMEIGQIIAKEGGEIIRNKVKGSMLRMLVTDGLIDSIVAPMGDEMERYLKEQGQEKIAAIVENELNSIEEDSIKDLVKYFAFDEEKLKTGIQNIYRDFVKKQVSGLLEKMDISKVVEEKVNQMDVLEIEKLLLSIMKKELHAIVNLGALIGLILGSLNVFI